MEKAYIDGIKSAKAWIKSQAAPVKVPPVHKYDHDEEEPVLAYLTNMMNMPKVELDKFDGNPLDFQSFIAVFDEVVDSKIDDDQVKLTRLLQYTSGQTKTAIKNCALVGGETGYKQAMEILRSRFGNAHLVSQSIISDLKNGKYVSKAQDLQQLSDYLCMALTALEKLKMYYEVNTQQCVLDILSRCQTYIQRRWRKKDFVEFIKLIASEACDPVYGSHQSRSQVKGASCNAVTTHQQAKYRYPGSFVQGNEQSQHRHNLSNDNCVVCNQHHRLFYCDAFKAMSPRARLDIVKRNRLCFNCLLRGHKFTECRKMSTCSVPGCNKKHTKFIHVDDIVARQDNINDAQVSNDQRNNTQANENEISSGNVTLSTMCSSVYLPIVPVIIDGKCETYALLDSGSTSSFITQRLASCLNLQGRAIHFKMNTLASCSNLDSKVVSVSLKSVTGEHEVKLDNVFIVSNIPVRYSCNSLDL